ncbi:MAG TPA: TIGR00730 family Rossman fold protein [Candidatus Paceibacterota bacterium]
MTKKSKITHTSNQICFIGPRIEEVLNMHPQDAFQPERMTKIVEEFTRGFYFLKDFGLAATIFGSARAPKNSIAYKETERLAYLLSKDGFDIITGGGPGVMEAANKGATEAGGRSGGINIQLFHEQRVNKYVTESSAFYYFFIRKVMLAFASEVYIFFPGGFGTLDEFFELVTLVQTKKIEPIPIILVDKDYWNPLLHWIQKEVYGKRKAISKGDMDLYHVAKDADHAFQLIRKMVIRTDRKVDGML